MSVPSPRSSSARGLDVLALTEPVDDQTMTAFISESKSAGKPWSRMTTGIPRPGVADLIGQFIPVVIPLPGPCVPDPASDRALFGLPRLEDP